MDTLHIIECPSNIGLAEPAPGKEPGVKKLPVFLKKYGFYDKVQPAAIHHLPALPYSMHLDPESGVRNAEALAAYARQQAALLTGVLQKNIFPLVLGGDCSILIGNMLALKKTGHYGLIFLDGHTDYASSTMSHSKGAAGMDLAIVTGIGHDKLTNIDQQKPYVKESNTWCVANRDYDEDYVEFMLASGIHYYDLDYIRATGIGSCIQNILQETHQKKLDGFWIHFDVDVLHNDIMPAVDSPQPDGLTYAETETILSLLLADEKATGMEITILDPDRDPGGKYTKPFANQLGSIFQQSRFGKTPTH